MMPLSDEVRHGLHPNHPHCPRGSAHRARRAGCRSPCRRTAGPQRQRLLVAAAPEGARRTIEEAQIVRLSVEDQKRFAELLIDPPPLAPAMKRALKARLRLIAGAK
jgi:hypothetical protein